MAGKPAVIKINIEIYPLLINDISSLYQYKIYKKSQILALKIKIVKQIFYFLKNLTNVITICKILIQLLIF